jgi:hypothetical protein
MNDDIKVNLEALDAFADQLEQRLAALGTAQIPGAGTPLPVGGEPAWEGQALSNAYWYSAADARDLLDRIREVLDWAETATRQTAQNYRGGDVNSADNNLRIAQAIASGQDVPGGTGGPTL